MSSQPPVQLTRFIGREQEISDITRLLSDVRLLALTGPGGCGKSRLAAAVAAQVKGRYEGGAVWVDLTSISDESLVARAVAKAVDEFIVWQRGAIGRDVNPSELIRRVVDAGALRLTVTAPAYAALDYSQLAVRDGMLAVTFGGLLDE